MNTLNIGDVAPDFIMKDMNKDDIRLYNFNGKKVLLCFFRYATCPFCTVRFVRLSQEVERYAKQGVQIIGVFESSEEYIQKYLGSRGLSFPIIPDPTGELYRQYGVKKSLPGLMFGMFRIPTLLRALFDREYHMAKPEGDMSRIPADFLINADKSIADTYYGSDIGDHISFKRIDAFAEEDLSIQLSRA